MSIRKKLYLGPYIECSRTQRSKQRYDVAGEDVLFEIHSEDSSKLFLAPNVRRDGDPDRELNEDEATQLELENVDPRAEMAWLHKAFAIELVKLKKAYRGVVVRWGLCQWYS